jgi:hypothetical protein
VIVGLLAAPAASVEIRLRDGTVIEAESYTLTGSFLMVKLPGGSQLAYDIADVDVEALKAAEADAAEQQPAGAPRARTPSLTDGRSLKVPPEGGPSGLTITDQDVKHVRDGATGAADEADSGDTDELPAGYQQGGQVIIHGLDVASLGQNRWQVKGEVINRSPKAILSVQVRLRTDAEAGQTPWTGSANVATALGPDERGSFRLEFEAPAAADGGSPMVRANVWYLQEEEPAVRRQPASTTAQPFPGPVPTPMV